MNGFIIAFIVVYCLVLCLYFYTETTGKLQLRAPNKIALALMFLVFACIQFSRGGVRGNYSMNNYSVLLIIGIFLSALGDIMLLFDFKVGGTFFLSGNACIFFYDLCLLTDNGIYASKWWWVFLILGIFTFAWAFTFFKTKFFNFEGKGFFKPIMTAYLLSVMSHGFTSIALMVYLPGQYTLLAVGSILFMLSDFAITFHKFKCPENKWVLRLNSGLYFSGLLLIVLSMAFIM